MAETAPVTILFTDIAGAGEHQIEVGDDLALELRRRHFRLIREAVYDPGGCSRPRSSRQTLQPASASR
jgi:class 3 adenylate cyclase